jgi:hypothetical protein
MRAYISLLQMFSWLVYFTFLLSVTGCRSSAHTNYILLDSFIVFFGHISDLIWRYLFWKGLPQRSRLWCNIFNLCGLKMSILCVSCCALRILRNALKKV